MENASKALLIAGGVLIGTILLSLMVIVFVNAGSLGESYHESRNVVSITMFNSKFEKYANEENLTVHDVISVVNLAKECKEQYNINVGITGLTTLINNINNNNSNVISNNIDNKYKMEITNWSDDGYISNVKFTKINT